MKSDRLPPVMSLESVSIGSKDYKFEYKKNKKRGVWSQKEVIAGSSSLLRLDPRSYISASSCIVGNVGAIKKKKEKKDFSSLHQFSSFCNPVSLTVL